MTPAAQKKVDTIIKNIFAAGYNRLLPDWNGCEVYEPYHNEDRYLEYPTVILVHGDYVRMSTRAECQEYLQYRKELSESRSATDKAG
ncbi:MAG: hypothetical protein LUD50_01775 [Clostridia bacterium]|nr:hypothetical protein [Clostridia bacterium]